jgi:uncharacterized protein (DUF2267 family)
MKYTEFITRVQQRAGMSSPEEALQAARATLETLGEFLSRVETRQTASELPKELAAFLHQRPSTWPVPLEEFFNRVTAREDVRRPQALEHARAVIGVLCEAVSPGAIADIRNELPAEYAALFQDEA